MRFTPVVQVTSWERKPGGVRSAYVRVHGDEHTWHNLASVSVSPRKPLLGARGWMRGVSVIMPDGQHFEITIRVAPWTRETVVRRCAIEAMTRWLAGEDK